MNMLCAQEEEGSLAIPTTGLSTGLSIYQSALRDTGETYNTTYKLHKKWAVQTI